MIITSKTNQRNQNAMPKIKQNIYSKNMYYNLKKMSEGIQNKE